MNYIDLQYFIVFGTVDTIGCAVYNTENKEYNTYNIMLLNVHVLYN